MASTPIMNDLVLQEEEPSTAHQDSPTAAPTTSSISLETEVVLHNPATLEAASPSFLVQDAVGIDEVTPELSQIISLMVCELPL